MFFFCAWIRILLMVWMKMLDTIQAQWHFVESSLPLGILQRSWINYSSISVVSWQCHLQYRFALWTFASNWYSLIICHYPYPLPWKTTFYVQHLCMYVALRLFQFSCHIIIFYLIYIFLCHAFYLQLISVDLWLLCFIFWLFIKMTQH